MSTIVNRVTIDEWLAEMKEAATRDDAATVAEDSAILPERTKWRKRAMIENIPHSIPLRGKVTVNKVNLFNDFSTGKTP